MKTYFHDQRGRIGVRVRMLMMISVMAPNAMRVNATPAGVKDSRPTLMKRNEQP
jgi:hypothetical protein